MPDYRVIDLNLAAKHGYPRESEWDPEPEPPLRVEIRALGFWFTFNTVPMEISIGSPDAPRIYVEASSYGWGIVSCAGPIEVIYVRNEFAGSDFLRRHAQIVVSDDLQFRIMPGSFSF